MERQVKRFRQSIAAVLGCLLLGLSFSAYGGFSKELDDGVVVTGGADMRIRLTSWDRETLSPEQTIYGGAMDNGPAMQYMRIRSRVWGSLQIGEDIKINARLVNRIHFVSSSPSSQNNDGAATWEYPDEIIFDKLNIELSNIGGSDWSLTLGRQDMILGNGMVMLEGTPYDQGRTIYFDGLSARYKGEKDALTLFAFYNDYKDNYVPINDQDRRLTTGNTFTTGANLTHNFSQCLNTDMYYIYANVNDTRHTLAQFDSIERNWPWGGPPPMADADVVVHTFGARVFGPLSEAFDYSFEYAEQRGEADSDADLTGSMLDARFTMKAPSDTMLSPSLMLEWTRFSGDDPSSSNEMEGWDPLFAGYPIWREELLPIMFNGNWTNMNLYRAQGNFRVSECVSAMVAYAYVTADFGELPNAGGGGMENEDGIGHLFSAFVDYKVNKWLKFSLEAAEFMPGGYWTDGDSSTWLRFQTVMTY